MTQRQIKLLLGDRPVAVGTLYFDATPDRYQSSFEYSADWLGSADNSLWTQSCRSPLSGNITRSCKAARRSMASSVIPDQTVGQ